jgi:fatty acid desaturase
MSGFIENWVFSKPIRLALVHVRMYWRKFLHSSYAPLLTHSSLFLFLVAEFALILLGSLWLVFVPCLVIHHRVGVLLHEYMHGIPFRRYQYSLWVLTVVNGAIMTFGFQEVFRGTHLAHHRWLNTDRDPGWRKKEHAEGAKRKNLQPLRLMYRILCGDHGIPMYIKYLIGTFRGLHPYVRPRRVIAEAALSFLWLLFWLLLGLPAVPVTLILLHLCVVPPAAFRGALEHGSLPGNSAFANEYKVRFPMFNMNRHVHHHLDATCPWYLLQYTTPKPLPPIAYWTTWYHMFIKEDYDFMQPMPEHEAVRFKREHGQRNSLPSA